MGTDARVRYTKKVIRDAFLCLLRKKSVKQITVTELCKMAEINRATFYKHYLDVFDLMEHIETGALNQLRETAQQIQSGNARNHLVRLLENARAYHQEFAVIISENGDPNFPKRVSDCLFEETSASVFCSLPAMPEEKKQIICRFLEGGGSRVLEQWVVAGMVQEPEYLANFILELSNSIIKQAS